MKLLGRGLLGTIVLSITCAAAPPDQPDRASQGIVRWQERDSAPAKEIAARNLAGLLALDGSIGRPELLELGKLEGEGKRGEFLDRFAAYFLTNLGRSCSHGPP